MLHAVVAGVLEMVAATKAKSELADYGLIFRAPALLASLRLYHPVPSHRSSAVTTPPVGLPPENPWIGLVPLLADILPLRPVIKAHAMTTPIAGTLLTCKIVMVHNNPPFWPPIFLDAVYHNI